MLLRTMPLRGADYWIVTVSSMEQLIGGALSTVISVMLPMLQMTLHPELPSVVQGIVGAMGLIGIGLGSLIIGKLSDKMGYLIWFRLCPIIIMAGSLICIFLPNVGCLVAGLLIIGIGTGGGYSLDSAYISELLPDKWRLFMVGVAKATCSIGFCAPAIVCYWILKHDPSAHIWSRMAWILFVLGAVTLLMRLRWAESPKWLMAQGKLKQAQKAAQKLLGSDVDVAPEKPNGAPTPKSKFQWGANMKKIIFSGIPWACEGLGVYGFSVFLPVMVMALGFEKATEHGIVKIMSSVEVTAVVNAFIIPGFIIGLWLIRKHNHVKMLYKGFIWSAIGLVALLISYLLKLPAWTMLIGFMIYEIALNAGPHLITYVIPPRIYPVEDRAEGNGIAALIGKIGAVAGVILMPILLDWGGMTLVLVVSAIVMIIGALIGRIYGRELGLVK